MSIVNSAKQYIQDSIGEAKKVTWPTKKQTINYSVLVIGMSIGLALFFAVLDHGLSLGVTSLLSR